ncbi:uncharacterized protein LOC133799850 [Humulus lupulus]|uniref:uncharacterized protein LOC133799850 n=1 Tax=Humulus lupulus TaxID=3486 RepID=UPI002B418606|nr:uncharacterized protein LOC133799850 [Humulus lupulus]
MSSGDMFDPYSAPTAPSSKKKESKRHRGESSKAPSTKKVWTGDPPAVILSRETMPPPSPLDETSPPAPTEQNPTPPEPADLTPHDQPGDVQTSTVGMLNMTVGWCRTGALITKSKESDAKHTEEVKVLEGKNTELLEQNSKLAQELQQFQAALTKANEDKEKFRECVKLNFQEAKQLEAELIASRKETEELEGCVKELEETNASNLESTASSASYSASLLDIVKSNLIAHWNDALQASKSLRLQRGVH